MKSKRSVLVNERGDLESEREEGGGTIKASYFIQMSPT